MGNSFSSGNHLFVYLDRPTYCPGDAVNGQVLLQCTHPFQSNALVLKVEGYESTRWEEKISNTTMDDKDEMITSDEIRPSSGKKELFSIKVPLQTFHMQVQPGQYQFPFTFVLPVSLPGSFEYTGNQLYFQGNQHNYLKAKIRYKVKAECEVQGMLKPDIRFKQHITVHERPATAPSQIVKQDQQHVKACCCCDKGFAFITARVEKDSYNPGEIVNVVLEVDNQTTAEFKSVTLQLHRKISLKSDGAGYHDSEDTLAEINAPGVKQGEKQLGASARRVSLQLPSDLQSSVWGHLVQCEYTLEVKLKAGGFMSEPCVKLPVIIYQAAPPYPTYTDYPAYWKPTDVPPPVQVALPSAPPLPPNAQYMGDASAYTPPQPTYAGRP